MQNSSVKFSLEKYLTICGKIEKTVAAIYEHWSNAPEFDQSMQDLWMVMRNEELDHFAQIEMLKRLTRGQDMGERTLSDQHVESLSEYACKCLNRIKETPLTARQALALAIQLEDTFMEFHAKQAFVCMDKQLEKMFGNLSRNDMEHSQRLKTTYAQLFPEDPPGHVPL